MIENRPHEGEIGERAELSITYDKNNRANNLLPIPREKSEVKKIINSIFNDYYIQIRSAAPGDKLSIIARVHQRLERAHAFTDGNTRTNLLILNKFLTEEGYSPAILNNPNGSYAIPNEEWVNEIKIGLERWQSVLRREERTFAAGNRDRPNHDGNEFKEERKRAGADNT